MIDATTEPGVSLNLTQYSVYSCLCYFSIFEYPLRENEISDFCDQKLQNHEISSSLAELSQLNLIYEYQGYYSVDEAIKKQIEKRKNSEDRFLRKLQIIRRFARFIARFPYVRFVGISGSCSKGLMDLKGDVDYFIITEPGKLWLCRTILVVFKKIFLLNSKKYFCVNYFIDSETLEIPDHNLFVAHEIKTLAPVNNQDLYLRFMRANNWANDLLPNKQKASFVFYSESKPFRMVGGLLEWLLNNRFGEKLDQWCFAYTLRTWKRKFAHFRVEEFELNFRSRKNISKHHPRGFQKKVIQELRKRLYHVRLAS